MGYCPFSKVESRYSKLYCDTRHGLGRPWPGTTQPGGRQGLAEIMRHDPAIRPRGPTTRSAWARGEL